MNHSCPDRICSVDLPQQPGSYLLVLKLAESTKIQVGRLGRIGFQRGWYAYAGSAFGPGGLAGRLRHHLRPVQTPHWHIDYLRAHADLVKVWMTVGPPRREHDWAHVLAKAPGAGKWVRGFGCSDCQCPAHLLFYDRLPSDNLVKNKLGAGILLVVLSQG